MQGILGHPIHVIQDTHDVMIGFIKLSKFTVLVITLSLIHVTLGMDTILENLLNWNKPKSVVVALGLAQWGPVDLPPPIKIVSMSQYKL